MLRPSANITSDALNDYGSKWVDKENDTLAVRSRHTTARELLKSWVNIQDETARIEVNRTSSSQWPTDTIAWPEERPSNRRSLPGAGSRQHVSDVKHKDNLSKLNKLCMAQGKNDRDALLASRVIQRLSKPASRVPNDLATRPYNRGTSRGPDFDDAVYSMEARQREREEKRRISLRRRSTDRPLRRKEPAERAGSSIDSSTEDNGRLLELARAQVRKQLNELRRSCAASPPVPVSSKDTGRSNMGKLEEKSKEGVEDDVRATTRNSSLKTHSSLKGKAMDRNSRLRERWRHTVENLASVLSKYEHRCRRPLMRKGFKVLLRATVDWKLFFANVDGSRTRKSKLRHFHAWMSLTRCILRGREEAEKENAREAEIAMWRASRVAKHVVKNWRRVSVQKGPEVSQLHSRVAAALARLPKTEPVPREVSGTMKPVEKRRTPRSYRNLNKEKHKTPRHAGNDENLQKASVHLATPPEVLRMYERAQRFKSSKIARELRRTEQECMTKAEEDSKHSNTEWRKRDHLKALKLRRRAIERNRLVVMERLQQAEKIWSRTVLKKCFGHLIDNLEERRFRELKAERWYLTVVRLKSIKAFTTWLESCRRLHRRAIELYQKNLAKRVLLWMWIASAQSREDRIEYCTTRVRRGRYIRLLRAWQGVATESLTEKYMKSDNIANRRAKQKAFSAWTKLPNVERFEREVDTKKAELWKTVHRMMGYQAHSSCKNDFVS